MLMLTAVDAADASSTTAVAVAASHIETQQAWRAAVGEWFGRACQVRIAKIAQWYQQQLAHLHSKQQSDVQLSALAEVSATVYDTNISIHCVIFEHSDAVLAVVLPV
jgi:uncharacterized protein YqfB (UPF0267 family)